MINKDTCHYSTFIYLFHSLKLKELFVEIFSKIKNKTNWDIKQYWKRICNLMSSEPVEDNIRLSNSKILLEF